MSRGNDDEPAAAADSFEAQVAQLHDIERSDLPERTKAAVRLADRLLSEDPTVDEALYQATREHFDDAQIADLGMLVTWASGWQRFIEAFGIRPDAWREGDPPPWSSRAIADGVFSDSGKGDPGTDDSGTGEPTERPNG